MSDARTHYDVLGVPATATPAEIKKAYFMLVRKYNPEQHEAEFKRVREAYEVLFDATTRTEYDAMHRHGPELTRRMDAANQYMAEGKYELAARELRAVLVLEPGMRVARNLFGLALIRADKPGQAIVQFEKLIADDPENALFHGHLGLAHFRAKNYREAEAALTKACSLSTDPDYVLLLADCYEEQELWSMGERVLERAIANVDDPLDSVRLHLKLIDFQCIQRKADKWRTAAQRLISVLEASDTMAPQVAAEFVQRALTLHKHCNYIWAQEYIQAAGRLAPAEPKLKELAEEICAYAAAQREWERLKDDDHVHPALRYLAIAVLEYEEEDADSVAHKQKAMQSVREALAGAPAAVANAIRYLRRHFPSTDALHKDLWAEVLRDAENRTSAGGNSYAGYQPASHAAAASSGNANAGCSPLLAAIVGAIIGSAIFPPVGTIVGAYIGWKMFSK